jgi:prepilin-type N-terminal cleavage/methylation domain-containing protein
MGDERAANGRQYIVDWISEMRLLHRGQRGFTLVEVLITIGLLGFIALAFFSFMSAATSSLIHADERTIAESLARSQLEFAKNQKYNPEATYAKLPSGSIPAGYTIVSLDSDGTPWNGPTDQITGIPWNSASNTTSTQDTGLQLIALVIEHKAGSEDKAIYTFINDSPGWPDGNGVPMTLQGYVRDPDAWAQT